MNSLIAKDYFYNFVQCRVLCHLFLKDNDCENTRFCWEVGRTSPYALLDLCFSFFPLIQLSGREKGNCLFPPKTIYILGCQLSLFPACISSCGLTFCLLPLFQSSVLLLQDNHTENSLLSFTHHYTVRFSLAFCLFLSFNNHHFLWIFLNITL